MTRCGYVVIFLCAAHLSWAASQPLDCSSDPEMFLPQEDDPDVLNQPTNDSSCELAVQRALECGQFLQSPIVPSASGKASEIIWFNGTTLENLIVKTSGKTAEFLSNLAFTMDKAETWREDKIATADPALMTRQMTAAKYLEKLNADGFGAVIANTEETLAKLSYTSFFSLGGIGSFLGSMFGGIGSIFGIGSKIVSAFSSLKMEGEIRHMEEELRRQEAKMDEIIKMLQVNFNNVQINFDKLNSRLDILTLSVEKTAVYNNYKINQGRIRDVREKYNQFVSNPGIMELHELHDICKSNDPHLALDWIQREVVYRQVGLQLMSTILEDVEYDRSKLRQWAKVIISDAMEAMYLREVCIGVWFGKMSNSTTQVTIPISNATFTNDHFNQSELYSSICNSRKITGKLFTDIIKTLDAVEQDLVQNFGKVLEKDLRKVLADYAYITPDQGENGLKPMYDEAVRRIRAKYYWTNCWLGLTNRNKPVVTSGDGSHFAQASDPRNMFFTAICTEKDAIHPSAEQITMAQIGQFWNSTAFKPGNNYDHIPFPDVFDPKFSNFDNLITATSSTKDYFVNAAFPFADVQAMTGAFCQIGGKAIPYSQCNSPSFIIYFSSKTIPNTMACKATSQELAQQKRQRFEKCSLEAFRLVVKSFVWTMAIKQFAVIKTMVNETADSKYPTMSDSIYNSLSSHFNDYHWEVYFILGESLDSCDVLETNCISIPFTLTVSSLPASKVIAVFSPKLDMSRHVGKAKEALDTMVKYSDHLFGLVIIREAMNATGDLQSALLAYMIDPPTYVKNENLTNIDDAFGNAMRSVNFYSNNVLTVLPKGSVFYAKSDDRSYRSSTARILTRRSMISEPFQQLSDHTVIVSYYGRYDKSNIGVCQSESG